jgi:hypothetical protein
MRLLARCSGTLEKLSASERLSRKKETGQAAGSKP